MLTLCEVIACNTMRIAAILWKPDTCMATLRIRLIHHEDHHYYSHQRRN